MRKVPLAPKSQPSLALRLWREFLTRYRGRFALTLLFMLGLAMAEASFVLLTEWIFSGVDPAPGRRFSATPDVVMVWGPVLVLALGLLQAALFYLQATTAQNIAVRTLRDLQRAMFARILTLDLAQTQANGSGELVSRFTNDMTTLRESLTRSPQAVRDIIRLMGLIGVLAFQDWVLFIAVLIIYPTIGFPVTWLGQRVRRASRAAQAQMGVLTGQLSESLRSHRLIKTHGLESYEMKRLGAAFDERYRLTDSLVRTRSASEPIITVIGAAAIAAIIGVAALRIDAGLLTGPELVSFLVGMAMLSQPARGLGTLNAVWQEGLAVLERVFVVLDLRPTIAADAAPAQAVANVPASVSPAQRTPGIRFRHVYLAYTPDIPVLVNFDLSIAPGSTVALVGPSGAGKTSVFGLLPRLYEVTAGAIEFDGIDIRSQPLAALRAQIAYVAQEAVLLDDTVAQNVRLGRLDATDAEIRVALRAAAADTFVDAMPGGLEARVGEGGGLLSGGQRQRIAIARAFLRDAPILLLDEATAALDAESERLIEDALQRLAQGRTTLIVAHRLSTIRNADLIVVLDQGRIVEQGTHTELLAKRGRYAQLLALQFREAAHA